MGGESVQLGAKRVCVNCGRVITAVKHPRVISLDAGIWAHVRAIDRLRCSQADPGGDGER